MKYFPTLHEDNAVRRTFRKLCLNKQIKIRQWSTKNCRFEIWYNNTLKSKTIRCKKLPTIVSGRKKVARPFVRRKQVRTSAEIRCCYLWAQVLPCFRLTKGRATFFPPETIAASFLHHMVLFYKVIFNHTKNKPFVLDELLSKNMM